jgi:hypothetical protein
MRYIAEIAGGANDGELHQIPDAMPCIRIPAYGSVKWLGSDEDMLMAVLEVQELVFKRDDEPKITIGDIAIFVYRLEL